MDSYRYFKFHWRILQYIGIYFPEKKSISFTAWSIFINTFVTFYYPLSLVIGFFQLTATRDILENLSLTFTIIACSLKITIFALRHKQMAKLKLIVAHLDSKIIGVSETRYMESVMKSIKIVTLSYATLYSFILIISGIGLFLSTEKRLLYPAWFPFDWKSSDFTFKMIRTYQYLGLCFQGSQNFINDSWPPALLCLLSGHIHVLGIRMENIGMDLIQSKEQKHQDLINCILDHKAIIEFYRLLHQIISVGIFIQILVTAFNLGITIVTFLFTANDLFQQLYFCAYLLAIPLQIYLACYYGTAVEVESSKLTNALYFNNWVDQDLKFKKDMITFMERTKRPIAFVAAGVTKITLHTFLSVMKSAFSLYAVLIQMKPQN